MNLNFKVKTNPLHNANYYLDADFTGLDVTNAKKIFEEFAQSLDKPLQVMISSEEAEAGIQDYVGDKVEGKLLYSFAGEESYEQCRELMLDRYILTHRNINPWTETKEEFFSELPERVEYFCKEGKLESFAFIEDDEIAYVWGDNVQVFHKFAQVLVTEMLQKYEMITFEADDCDEIAMELKSMFVNQSEESFDTYIRER